MMRPTHRAARAGRGIVELIFAAALLSACAVGPNYKRPVVAAPAVFRGEDGAVEQASIADLPWWEVFNDPALVELVRTALANNYNLLEAIQRVEQARAVAVQVRSAFFPQLGYELDAAHGRNAIAGRPATTQGKTTSSFLGFLNAAWEV